MMCLCYRSALLDMVNLWQQSRLGVLTLRLPSGAEVNPKPTVWGSLTCRGPPRGLRCSSVYEINLQEVKFFRCLQCCNLWGCLLLFCFFFSPLTCKVLCFQLSAGNCVLPVLVACVTDPTVHVVTVHVIKVMCLIFTLHYTETFIKYSSCQRTRVW